MIEFIITDKQLKTATEAYVEHELSLPITGVFVSGDKLPEIIRCRNCRHSHLVKSGITGQIERRCIQWFDMLTESDGFCHKGERKELWTDSNQSI